MSKYSAFNMQKDNLQVTMKKAWIFICYQISHALCRFAEDVIFGKLCSAILHRFIYLSQGSPKLL